MEENSNNTLQIRFNLKIRIAPLGTEGANFVVGSCSQMEKKPKNKTHQRNISYNTRLCRAASRIN